MKKLVSLLLTLILLLGICACSDSDTVIASLPKYSKEVLYTDGGFQDFTDYGKYFYESVTAQELEASEYFTAAAEEDVEEILSYIDDFENWVEAADEKLRDGYDFDKAIVSEGDFFCIITKDGEPIGDGAYGKFDDYTVYYFDLDAQILYYFHSNI